MVIDLSVQPLKKLTVFITIDTEDDYFPIPRLITGEGLDGNPGIYKILDITERYGFRSNVFLDVYNHNNFAPGVIQGIAQAIHARGHAVELHTHPDYAKHLDFYRVNIYQYPLEGQIRILEYGRSMIHKWTGRYPMAHRGGAYAMNEDTLTALRQVGIPIDSSFFLGHINNRLEKAFTVNRVSSWAGTIEVPVTSVKIVKPNGRQRDSKFDIDALNYDQLTKVIKQAKEGNLQTLTLFLHSFTFIKRRNKKFSDEDDPQALFSSLSRGGSLKCEILGIDEADIVKYDKLLSYIADDPEIQVLTLRDWYQTNPAVDSGADFIPVVES